MSSCRSLSHFPHNQGLRIARNSRRVSRRSITKQNQLWIINPFLGSQQNYLPLELHQQIQNLPYISPNNIQNINFKTSMSRRRSSAFQKYLQVMQTAAKKQQQMYKYFVGDIQDEEDSEGQAMEEEQPMTIEQNDQVSLGMHHRFFNMEHDRADQEDFNLFSCDPPNQEQIVYYSQNQIQQSGWMQDDYETYLNV